MTMIEMTIISSSSVKPRALLEREERKEWGMGRGSAARPALSPKLFTFPLIFRLNALPVTVFLPVERRLCRFRAHVEDVFARATGGGVRRLVRRAQTPIGLPRHG